MIRVLTSAFALLWLTGHGLAQQAVEPGPARSIFSDMVAEQMKPMRDHRLSPELVRQKQETREHREKAIRTDPGAYVPLIREALTLPKPEDLQVPTTPEGRLTDGTEQYQKQIASRKVAAQVLSLLPADVRDPILRESFERAYAVARSERAIAVAERERWRRAGADERDKAKGVLAIRRLQWFEGACIELIDAAAAAKSEVLLEPVFAAIADSGSDVGLNQQVGKYLEALVERRDEILRRLSDLLAEIHAIDRVRKHDIDKWIKRMEAGRS